MSSSAPPREDHDLGALKTEDGIATIDGQYPSKGTGEHGAWFRDCEGNLIGWGRWFAKLTSC